MLMSPAGSEPRITVLARASSNLAVTQSVSQVVASRSPTSEDVGAEEEESTLLAATAKQRIVKT
jgi:hypothetical protein